MHRPVCLVGLAEDDIGVAASQSDRGECKGFDLAGAREAHAPPLAVGRGGYPASSPASSEVEVA
ncbi:hypothetical protein BH20CHL6_BH20CHL6_15140 [soil metagenome]